MWLFRHNRFWFFCLLLWRATGAFGGTFFAGSSFASRNASVIALNASRQLPVVAVLISAFIASSSLVIPHPSAMITFADRAYRFSVFGASGAGTGAVVVLLFAILLLIL
jgi:hypothetical protein